MIIKLSHKGFNLIVHNTNEQFGGIVESNSVFTINSGIITVEDGKKRFWDITASTLPELQTKFEQLVDRKLAQNE